VVNSELACDAASPGQFPSDGLPEVAVMGRSNVGKSSLVNALLGRRKLARTSARPGKTRRIHFYRVEGSLYLVDLPGYGYAAVSKREQGTWQPLVESYLRGARQPLRGAILIIDIRRGPEREERDLLDWLAAERIPVALALTKSDKLSSSQAARRLRELSAELEVDASRVAAVSARTGSGLASLAGWIRDWTDVALRRPDGGELSSAG
jgi:GTP-binding protein